MEETMWTYVSVNVSVFPSASVCRYKWVDQRGRLCTKPTHSGKMAAHSLSCKAEVRIMQNRGECCNTGLGERQDSLFIAPTSDGGSHPSALFCRCTTYWRNGEVQAAVWATASPAQGISSWVRECVQQLPTEIRLPLCRIHGKALTEPQDE